MKKAAARIFVACTFSVAFVVIPKISSAAHYQILFPDNELKKYVFGDEAETKEIGPWKCLFATIPETDKEAKEKGYYAAAASCKKGKTTVETIAYCNDKIASTLDGRPSSLRIFEDKKRWDISIYCAGLR